MPMLSQEKPATSSATVQKRPASITRTISKSLALIFPDPESVRGVEGFGWRSRADLKEVLERIAACMV
jgi:hypothetical protein